MFFTRSANFTHFSVFKIIFLTLLVVGLIISLSACSTPSTTDNSKAKRIQSFKYNGHELKVDNDYSDVDIDYGEPGTVIVREFRTVVGSSADEPEWLLHDGTLNLGRPCSSTIGICQIRYRVTVPEGTAVVSTQNVKDAG